MKIAIALLALALAACTTAPATSGAALPPGLQRVLDDYTRAWSASDAKALAALFAEGRTVVPNACAPVPDRAGIEKCYTGHGGPLNLRALDHGYSGDLAYIIGEYAEKAGDPAGGKFVLTLTKGADGNWLIVADMDQPYRRQPPPQ